jgi:hypothetical protein
LPKKAKRRKPKHLTLADVDYEVSDGDTFYADFPTNLGDKFEFETEWRPKKRRKGKVHHIGVKRR